MSIFFAKNFKYSEVMCPCGCKKDRPLNPELTYLLQALRDRLDMPIYISSGGGVRCKKYNKKIKGFRDSPHLYGKAADISTNMDIVSFARHAKNVGFSRVGLYPFSHFVHVDVVEPYPSESWVRDINGKYHYFKTLEKAIDSIK